MGRCADYILAGQNPYQIFVYSDLESKMIRYRQKGAGQEPSAKKELKRYIHTVNRSREKYYNFFTGQVWGGKLNYYICINMTHTSAKKMAVYPVKNVSIA